MRAILAILLAGAVFYAYQKQQKISSLEEELEASRSEVVALKKELEVSRSEVAALKKRITESSTSTSLAPAASKPNAHGTPSGQWMWDQKTDNPLAAPAQSQKHK